MPKVTVYVRVPTAESLNTHTYNHSFIQLGDSPTEVYGFEPAGRPTTTQPGRVVNDSWRLKAGDYQAKMTLEVTDEQYNRIVDGINRAIKNPPNYNLFSNVTDDPNDRQCSMFVNDLLKSANVKDGLVGYETPYGHYFHIKTRELLESTKSLMPELDDKTDIERFMRNFWGVPFSSVEDAFKNYARTGRLDDDLLPGNDADNRGAGQEATGPGETAALENDPQEEEEDMYAYSSFYPGC